MKVAVVGCGRMGSAMVRRLRRADTQVAVFNRTHDKAEQLAAATGASVADTARDEAQQADVTMVSLADDAAVEATYKGPDGLADGLRPDAVVLEMSTIDPQTVQALAGLVGEHGGALLNAPVSGSVSFAEQGQLTVMVGGEERALDRARPVLDLLAKQIFHGVRWALARR